MLRLVEILLFLAPFVLFAAWFAAASAGGPPPRVLAASAALLVLLLAGLLWLRREGALPAGTAYVPATLQDGRIVPGHGVPRP